MLVPWPPAPDPASSNLDHALLYARLGWWVLPGRDDLDLLELREGERRRLIKKGATPEDAAVRAAGRAERARKHTFVRWRELAASPTEADLRAWLEERPLRPLVALTGLGRGICVVDVDVAKGGVAGPWVRRAGSYPEDDLEAAVAAGADTTTGLLARTPAGGWHALHLEADVGSSEGKDDPATGRQHGVADGVDIRGRGGLVVLPSGDVATPGRRWARWGSPTPFPLPEVVRRLAERAGTRGHGPGDMFEGAGGATGQRTADLSFVPEGGGREALGAFALAVTAEATDGTKNPRAKTIVGMLARLAPLPADAREACLELLEEHARLRQWDRGLLASLRAGWRAQLESSARHQQFAAEVLLAWDELRCRPRWGEDKASDAAASLWRSARAGEQAARVPVAEDDMEGDELAPVDDDLAGADPDEAARQLLPTLGALYGEVELAADLSRELLSIAALPHWLAPGGEPDRAARWGHGAGETLDQATGGGVRPGIFWVLGAESAKHGKTALVDQWIDGLLLRSALVLSGALTGPVVVAYYLTEMSPADLTHRQLGRWLGVDSTVFRRGRDRAHLAPGLRRLADRLGRDPRALASEYHEAAAASLRGGLLARARDLRVVVQSRLLMGPEDHEGAGRPKDHRRGVLLVRATCEAIRRDRARRAAEWGRAESEVWPLLFVDPVQRFQREGDGDSVGALDELVEELRAVSHEDNLIVLATSDTNKESAKGQRPKNLTPYQLAAHVFRGSYKLMHLPDLALVLKVTWPDAPGEPALAEVIDALNRWGAPSKDPHAYDFHPDMGRYSPRMPAEDDAEDQCSPPVEDEEPAPPPPRVRGKFATRGKVGAGAPGEGVP